MSLPLKRKREASLGSIGNAARSTNNLETGGYTGRGRVNARGSGRGCGRGRGRGCVRGRSFHIPKHASQTAILTEVWKHHTHGIYALPSQSDAAPPSPPTSDPNVESPSAIAETLPPLHGPPESDQYHDLGDFFSTFVPRDTQPIHPRKAHRPNGPSRQTHQNKRQKQASTWMDQVIPQLIEPFMDLLRRTKSGRVSVPPTAPNDDACSCSSVALRVTCVSWNC